MASENDFKIIHAKSLALFKYLGAKNTDKLDELEKARLGFYHLVLENVTGIGSIPKIQDLIIDVQYNKIVKGLDISDDMGIDAYYINEDTNEINLFNFKYRVNFNEDKTISENDIKISSKFFTFLMSDDIDSLPPDKVYNCLVEINSKRKDMTKLYKYNLYMVSNESNGFNEKTYDFIEALKRQLDLEVKSLTLAEISSFIFANNKSLSSTFILNNDDLLVYQQDNLSTEKSYIVKMSIPDLLKITCDDKNIRIGSIPLTAENVLNLRVEHSLLYENVRGYLGETNYNKNILKTLENNSEDFFLYNNGLTIVANRIDAISSKIDKKVTITITDYQIVNGGQTVKTIYKYLGELNINTVDSLANGNVLVRIFSTTNPKLKNNIAEYTNSQNAISAKDLKSVSNLQVDIENYLQIHEYLYVRKLGDVGKDSSNYKARIDFETLTQIIYSSMGFPDRVSNQKKAMFEKYYDDIYSQISLETCLKLVDLYFYIKSGVENSENIDSEQKVFYLVYALSNYEISLENAVIELNTLLESFENKSRSLIMSGCRESFIEALENKYEKISFI